MASGHYGSGVLGRLLGWVGRRVGLLFDTCGASRPSASLRQEEGRTANTGTPQHTYPRVSLARRVLFGWTHGRGVVFASLLCAVLLSNREPPIPAPDASHVTRVMIVDDHPVVRRGIKLSLLSFPEFEVVGEAASGEEAIRLLEDVHPDIILMDLVMPGMGGLLAIRAIHDVTPDARIIVLTSFEEGGLVQEALQAGAIGYQLKGGEIDELVNAVRLAAGGIPTLAPAAAQALVRVTSAARKFGDDLTDREREVLALLARGLPNTAIAKNLVVTVATVKFHLRSIRSKLGTSTRTETVAVALQNRLVPPP